MKLYSIYVIYEELVYYTYDASGNRTGKKVSERETKYFNNEKNQLTEEVWDTGRNRFTYDYLGSILKISRTKVIDRFIRKISRIYNQIDKNKNCYFLNFFYEGNVIYIIPYDDFGYPENVVKIMSDDILKNMNM